MGRKSVTSNVCFSNIYCFLIKGCFKFVIMTLILENLVFCGYQYEFPVDQNMF